MDFITLLCLFAIIAGLYATWNIGANDVSNAMGTSVGSKSLTLKQAVIIAGVCEFLGAWLFGSNVSQTLRSGLINTQLVTLGGGEYSIVLGMLAALLATGMWLHFASYWGLPVSTTHSIVGAIVGFGLTAGGIDAIEWDMVGRIASSWVISPIFGCLGSYVIFTLIRKTILSKPAPLKAARKALPWICGMFITSISAIWISATHIDETWMIICLLLIFIISYGLFRLVEKITISHIPEEERQHVAHMEKLFQLQTRKSELLYCPQTDETEEEQRSIDHELNAISELLHPASLAQYEEKQFTRLERLFGILQVATAALMAFSHGANDVANGIGPLEAILETLSQKNNMLAQAFMPHILLLGGIGIVTGLATWGWRVIETIGKNITELTPSRGFSAEFGASITILMASKLGLPISTTHTLVGAVIGVGLAGGITSLNIKTLRDIVASWVVTIPGGAILSILWYQLFEFLLPFFI